VSEDEREHTIGVRRGEQGGEAPPIAVAEQHRSIGPGAIQNGTQMRSAPSPVGAHIER